MFLGKAKVMVGAVRDGVDKGREYEAAGRVGEGLHVKCAGSFV